MSESDELKDVHDKLHSMIDEIDEKLDSLMDPTTAGKTKIINERVSAQQVRADAVVNNLVTQLENSSIDEKIGIYFALVRGLNKAYKEPVEEAIAELLKSQPKVEPLISEAEAAELSKVRSDLAGKVKQLRGMADIFGDSEGFREAKKRTGKNGPRGPRALSLFTFSVGEKEYKDLKGVAEDYAQYYDKAADITAAMRGDTLKKNEDGTLAVDEKGKNIKVRGVAGENNPNFIDTSNPPDEFAFTLPDGSILIGTKNSAVADNGEDDDDDEETESE